MADITRDQFNEENFVTRKLFQKGRYVADADLNEQAQIFQNYDRRLLSSFVNFVDKRLGDGFKVISYTTPLTVIVKAGFAAFHLADKSAVLLKLDNDLILSGFSDWTEERTDYIYVDIEEKEITPDDDIVIVNPLIGEETCRDMRLFYEIKISEGTAPNNPPAGHIYRTLATITKTIGSYITDAEIELSLPNYHVDLPTLPQMLIYSLRSEKHDGSEAPGFNEAAFQFYVEATSGLEVNRSPLRFQFAHQNGATHLVLRARVWRDPMAEYAYLVLDSYTYGGVPIWIPKTSTTIEAYCPVSGSFLLPSSNGRITNGNVAIRIKGTNVKAYMIEPVISMGFGSYEIKTYSD